METPQTNDAMPEPESPNYSKIFTVKLLVAILAGVAFVGISLFVGWQNAQDNDSARAEQYLTEWKLGEIDKAITLYQKTSGSIPHSFDELLKTTNGTPNLVVDGWQRPFVFAVNGTNCLVTSYGRDGKPGGVGLDCDLTNKDPKPSDSQATFKDFMYDMPSGRIIKSCMACGGLAFLMALFTSRIKDLRRIRMMPILFQFGATILGAIIVGCIISFLHLPHGGH